MQLVQSRLNLVSDALSPFCLECPRKHQFFNSTRGMLLCIPEAPAFSTHPIEVCSVSRLSLSMFQNCRLNQAFETFLDTYFNPFRPPAAKKPETICFKLDARTVLPRARRNNESHPSL